jgi:quinol monooxygenase YgiN
MTTAESLVVVAHWQVTEASLQEVLRHIAVLRPQALAEPGCLAYEIYVSVDEPTTLVLLERYRDKSALDSHLNSSHYQDVVVGRIRPLLTDRRVEILRVAP